VAHTRIVLVRPELAANVGASARAIGNAGLAGLDLVSPADWRSVEAWRTAWGATAVLEGARVFDDLRAAVGQASYVVGFSRRAQEGVTLDVRDVARELQALPSTATAALVFGPETSGLSLEELALCGRVATIPSHSGQPSFNLSHAVLVVAYEVFRATPSATTRPTLATHAEKERVLALLFDGLRAIHAFGGARPGVYGRLWRGLLQRMDLTPREARGLAHMARKMARARRPERAIPSEPTRQLDRRVVPRPLTAPAVTAEGPPPGERRISPSERPSGRSARAREPERGPTEPVGAALSVPAPPAAEPLDPERPNPFADVEPVEGGFSIPRLKWRELLFVGALRREGDLFARDIARPLPPFERQGLFPANARFEVRERGERVELRRR
jgi:tRNA/rRNA methyltransferase